MATPPEPLSPVEEEEEEARGLLYEAYNELQGLAAELGGAAAPTPAAAAVVGHQTDGKSALFEALMGFRFNHVGGGTKTRRPVALHLRFNPRCHVPHCRLLAGSVGGEGKGAAADDAGCPMPLADVQEYIDAENTRLENDPCQFSEKEIIASIEYKHCPNLTIINTPGLTFQLRDIKTEFCRARLMLLRPLFMRKSSIKKP